MRTRNNAKNKRNIFGSLSLFVSVGKHSGLLIFFSLSKTMTITADAWTLLSNETRKNGANEYTFLYDNLFCEPDKIIILTAKNTFEKKNIDLRHDNCLRVN